MYLIINLLLQPYRFKAKGNFGAKPSRQLSILSTTIFTTLYASPSLVFITLHDNLELVSSLKRFLVGWQNGKLVKCHYFGAKTLGITSISIMTFSITTLNIEGSFATLSINDTQRNNTPTMLSVTVNLYSCWMLLGRVSLCRVSWRHYFCSKFQKFLLHFLQFLIETWGFKTWPVPI